MCVCVCVCVCVCRKESVCILESGAVPVAPSVLEADVVADLTGGAGAGLGQVEPPVGADADLVDALPAPGGRGAGRGLPLGQPHQPDPPGVQGNLRRSRRERVRGRHAGGMWQLSWSFCFDGVFLRLFYGSSKPSREIPGSVERPAGGT